MDTANAEDREARNPVAGAAIPGWALIHLAGAPVGPRPCFSLRRCRAAAVPDQKATLAEARLLLALG